MYLKWKKSADYSWCQLIFDSWIMINLFLYINCSKIESDQAKTKKYCKNIKNQLISADLCLKIDISFEMLIGSRIIDEIWKKMRGGTFIIKSASFTNSALFVFPSLKLLNSTGFWLDVLLLFFSTSHCNPPAWGEVSWQCSKCLSMLVPSSVFVSHTFYLC